MKKKREEAGEQLRTLSPSRLIRPVTTRITFVMSLEWDGSSENFDLFVEDGFLTLRDRFRAGEPPGAWLEVLGTATAWEKRVAELSKRLPGVDLPPQSSSGWRAIQAGTSGDS